MQECIRPCPYCGAPLSNPQQVTCRAIDCKRKQNAKRSLERYHAAKRGETQQHLCKECSSPVERAARCGPWPTYCSDACRDVAMNDMQQRRRREATASHPTQTCEYCDGPLPPGSNANRRFCSPTCQCRSKHGVVLPSGVRTCAECQTEMPADAPLIQRYCGPKCKNKVTYRRHAEKNRTAAAAWRRKNPERFAKSQAEQRKKNPDQRRAAMRAAYAADPLRWKNARDLRRARLREHPNSVPVSQRDWDRLLRRYRGACAYCGSKDQVTMEHVVPVSRGGRHGIGNVLPACWPCNHSKSNKLLVEWRRFLRWTEASHAMEALATG